MATQQHLQRRRKNLTQVLDNVKVYILPSQTVLNATSGKHLFPTGGQPAAELLKGEAGGSVQVLEGITAAQEALELLLPAGDFAGALDVLWDLKAAGTPAHMAGLHAIQMLPQHLAACEEVTDPEQPPVLIGNWHV